MDAVTAEMNFTNFAIKKRNVKAIVIIIASRF